MATRKWGAKTLALDVVKALVISIASCAVGLAVNAMRPAKDVNEPRAPHGIPLVAERPYEYLVPCPEVIAPASPLDPAGAAKIHGGDDVLFVDARDADFFEALHIRGATSVPYDPLEEIRPVVLRPLLAFGTIVVYGDPPEFDDIGRAELLAGEIHTAGGEEVSYVPEGVQALQQAGLSTASGPPGPLPEPGLDYTWILVLVAAGAIVVGLALLGVLRPRLFWRSQPWLAVPVRLALGFVFVAAAWHKVINPEDFALNIATYELLPLSLINLMAVMLPWLELGCALLLFVGWQTRPAALATIGMNFMFMVALYIALRRDLQLGDCGCFASEEVGSELTWGTFWRDVGFVVMGAYVYVFGRPTLGLDRLPERFRQRRAHA